MRTKEDKSGPSVSSIRNSFGIGRDFSGPSMQRDLHDAKCSECGKDCQVPFKPIEGRPVYCRDCYRKKKVQQ